MNINTYPIKKLRESLRGILGKLANVLAQAGRVEEPGQTAKRIPALPAANCWAV
jgi:hypothetical protein